MRLSAAAADGGLAGFCSPMGIKNAEATMLSAVAPASVVIGHRKYREKIGMGKGKVGIF